MSNSIGNTAPPARRRPCAVRVPNPGAPAGRSLKPKLAMLFVGLIASLPAYAHVKWFSKMADCTTAPITTLEIVASPLFWGIGMLAFAVIFASAAVDSRLSRGDNLATRWAAWLDRQAAQLLAPLLRIGTALYFIGIVSYFSETPIILTAELKTAAAWVPVLQLAIAAAAMSRRGAALSALGIVVLYAYAVSQYGVFHMLDYPFFLGLAAFLSLDALYGRTAHVQALALLRLTVGFSLIWCGVEKWLYPAWTYELLQSDLRGLLQTGLSPSVIIMGAGFVEFCLAFVLIFGKLASQIAAAVLFAVMTSAIPLVGMIDLIGHLPILIVLIILAATRNPIVCHAPTAGRDELDLAISFVVSVPGFVGAYYLSHEIAYRAVSQLNWTEMGLAGLLVALLLLRIVWTAAEIFRPALVRFHPA